MKNKYQSGFGTLIYLTRFSWTELSNAVRELRKNMGKYNDYSYKQLKIYLKFTCDTINNGLEIKINKT